MRIDKLVMKFFGFAMIAGLILWGKESFADTSWYETEGITSAAIEEKTCAEVREKFTEPEPWTLEESPYGQFGEVTAEKRGKEYWPQSHAISHFDAMLASRTLLQNGARNIPWIDSMGGIMTKIPAAAPNAATVTRIMEKIFAQPQYIVNTTFVAELMQEGGGKYIYRLQFDTDESGHTRAKQLYTFATNANQKPKEYVLCISWVPMRLIDEYPAPEAPIVMSVE